MYVSTYIQVEKKNAHAYANTKYGLKPQTNKQTKQPDNFSFLWAFTNIFTCVELLDPI